LCQTDVLGESLTAAFAAVDSVAAALLGSVLTASHRRHR
jgi:hypothetical protein